MTPTAKRQTHRTTISGKPITDEMIAAAVARAEVGYDPAKLVPRIGRPLIGSSPAKTLAVRFPPELRAKLVEQAKQDGVAEAEVVRRAVNSYFVGLPGDVVRPENPDGDQIARVTRRPRVKVLKDGPPRMAPKKDGAPVMKKGTGSKPRARKPRPTF